MIWLAHAPAVLCEDLAVELRLVVFFPSHKLNYSQLVNMAKTALGSEAAVQGTRKQHTTDF